jgi:hypothetical protein
MKNRRTIVTITGFLLFLLMVWVFTAVLLNSASADSGPFSFAVKSKLAADYGGEKPDGFLGVINLTIFGDVMRDLGLSPEEADEHSDAMKVAMDDLVPTATARNFEGEEPWTPTKTATKTPTRTQTPEDTPAPTYTPTRTRVLSKTPSSTNTKKPATAVPAGDTVSPVIADPGVINPTPSAFASCSRVFSVSNARITDAAPSSGINYVKLKYKVYDNAEAMVYAGYIYSAPFSICSGGPTGGGWDACYSGSMTISIFPGFSAKPDYTGPGPFKIKVWLIIEDNTGKTDSHFYGYYSMPMNCDDPPPPTATPLPTDTSNPSILSLNISPPPGSVLTSCDLMVTDMQVSDPAFSFGISASGVEIKHYRITTSDYHYQSVPTLTGNFVAGPSSDWDGNATGPITLKGLNAGEVFDLYGVLTDVAANGPVHYGPLTYTMDSVTTCP